MREDGCECTVAYNDTLMEVEVVKCSVGCEVCRKKSQCRRGRGSELSLSHALTRASGWLGVSRRHVEVQLQLHMAGED